MAFLRVVTLTARKHAAQIENEGAIARYRMQRGGCGRWRLWLSECQMLGVLDRLSHEPHDALAPPPRSLHHRMIHKLHFLVRIIDCLLVRFVFLR
jgi:hypothetical protein